MSYQTTRRDRFVWAVSTWLFRNIATKEYESFVFLLMKKGKKALDKELASGKDS